MSWRLSIVCLFLLISLGSELCLVASGGGAKERPSVACLADDVCTDGVDDGDAVAVPVSDFDFWAVMPPCARFSLVRTTDMILSCKGVEVSRVLSAEMRRHRWFCVELC